MNQACRILDKVLVSKGGLTETAVDIRLILREALLRRAPVIALCHNHPSGQVRPQYGGRPADRPAPEGLPDDEYPSVGPHHRGRRRFLQLL